MRYVTTRLVMLVLIAAAANADETTTHSAAGVDLVGLSNPVWSQPYNLRDPAVLPADDGYLVFYSRFTSGEWGDPQNWSIACARTSDFRTFTDDRDVSPKGYASPDAPVFWHGRYVLAYQNYPGAARLCFAESSDGRQWSRPAIFLEEAVRLPWNGMRRAIDPTMVVDGDTLHCFFIGSEAKDKMHTNLLGHAVTKDPALKQWDLLTRDAPLLGASPSAPDGVENVAVFKTGDVWTMIYSEDLRNQHLAYGQSPDLRRWQWKGPIAIPAQTWMKQRRGAPFVWRDGDRWLMILMGTDPNQHTTFGLLSSNNGDEWTPLPERAAASR